MHMYMHVYVYVYMYTHVYVHVHVHILGMLVMCNMYNYTDESKGRLPLVSVTNNGHIGVV